MPRRGGYRCRPATRIALHRSRPSPSFFLVDRLTFDNNRSESAVLLCGLQTTTAPALVERVGDEVRKAGATMIDAPVMVRSTSPALLSAKRSS